MLPWLVGRDADADRGAAPARWASACRAIPSRAPPSRWRCGTSTAARSASRSIACSAAASAIACRCRGRSPSSSPEAELAEAREKVAKGHRIFKIKTAAHPVAEDVARVPAIREAVGPEVAAARGRQSGLGPADGAAGDPGHGALRPGFRRAAGAALGSRRPGRDRAQRDGADHGRRVVRLAPGRAGHRPARRRVDPRASSSRSPPGWRTTMAIARIAEAAGLGCYVGCMIETSLGTAAYLQAALAAAPVTWGCELFGPLLLAGDVVRGPGPLRRRCDPRPGRPRPRRRGRRNRCSRSGLDADQVVRIDPAAKGGEGGTLLGFPSNKCV